MSSRTYVPPSVLEELRAALQAVPHGDSSLRREVFESFKGYGGRRTLTRRLQEHYGRARAARSDFGESSALLLKAAEEVAQRKRDGFALTGRWLSTARAIKELQATGKLPADAPSVASVNRIISNKNILESRRSFEVIGAPNAGFKQIADSSGSLCFRTVSWQEDPVIEITPAPHATDAKNHPLEARGRRRCYVYASVDAYSGFVQAGYQCLVAPNSHSMAEWLLSGWKRFGAPEHFLSDNGAEMKGSTDLLLESCGVNRIKSAPNRPWARGQVERFFRTLWSDFETPVAQRLGVGSRVTLSDLNGMLSEWLGAEYNQRKARWATSSRESRYVSFSQRSQIRQVPDGLTLPRLVMRTVKPLGRGVVEWQGRRFELLEKGHSGSEVAALVVGDEVQAVLINDVQRVAVRPYAARSGAEFLEWDQTNQNGSERLWRALLSVGVTEGQLLGEVGSEGLESLKKAAVTATQAELVSAIEELLP